MPEGHTLHRLAREHTRLLAGRPVAVRSPQGRFAGGAAVLDGRVLEEVEAYGKHLLYRWADEVILHVHLGLFGAFRTFQGEPPEPSAGTRLSLSAGGATVYLAGPTACALVDDDEVERILGRLGPDPLRPDADPEQVWRRLQRRRIPIGAALLDQKVLAGVGNVYRAEALHVCGIHPDRAANALSRAEFDRLWHTIVGMLRRGVRAGRIVTVDPADAGGKPRSRMRRDEAHYVYRRAGQPCRRCGTLIRSWQLGGRTISACPRCQPS